MKYLYLIIDLAVILIPFIYSFHKKINFISEIKAAISAIVLVAVPFIGWDIFFTRSGVWEFNSEYITGVYFFGLPVEELFFFFCIPYSCLFTHFVLKKYFSVRANNKYLLVLFSVTGFALILTALFHVHRMYTAFSLGLSGLAILISLFAFRDVLYKFSFSYLILLFPFFLVNGILTGTGIEEPVVRYDDKQNLGFRILSIPFEDFFYGFLLLLSNVIMFEMFSSTHHEPTQA